MLQKVYKWAIAFLALGMALLGNSCVLGDLLTGQTSITVGDIRRIEKKDIAGCWHEVKNPVTSFYCVDLCFSLKTDDFEQVLTAPEPFTYKVRYDLLGIKWTETTRTQSLKAYGNYSLDENILKREFVFPDPPDPDTAEMFRPETVLKFRDDTLIAAGHLYLRPDSLLNCGLTSIWKTFDPNPPDPDPPKGGGGGFDWD